jgi:hypothetical protein
MFNQMDRRGRYSDTVDAQGAQADAEAQAAGYSGVTGTDSMGNAVSMSAADIAGRDKAGYSDFGLPDVDVTGSGTDGVNVAKGGLVTRYATGGFVKPQTTQGVGYADGGELPQGGPESIGAAMEGQPQPGPVGPVQGPGGPTEDAIPAELPEGSFVLNAEAVKITGQKKLNGLVNEAMEAMGPEAFMDPNAQPGPMGEAPQPLPVNISNGEWVLSPPLVDYFGLEFWEKMNDKGLPEGEKSTDKAKSGFKAEGVKADSQEAPAEMEELPPEMAGEGDPMEALGALGLAAGGFLEQAFGDDKGSKLKSDGEEYDPKLTKDVKKEAEAIRKAKRRKAFVEYMRDEYGIE